MTQGGLQTTWLKALLFALFGYALLGKAFAYLFVGEMILMIGVLVYFKSQRAMLVFNDSVLLLWLMFAALGLCRTVPFLAMYRFDAVRDSVLWGYGIFAVLVAAFVRNSDQISRALNTYRRFLLWYLPLVPFLMLLSNFFRDKLPVLPWGKNITVVMLRTSETGVHLSAAAIFLLLFSGGRRSSRGTDISLPHVIGFVGWTFAATIVLIVTRSGFLAIVLPIALASVLQVGRVGWKVAGLATVSAVLALTVLTSEVITIKVHQRTFTSQQLLDNVASIFGSGDSNATESTKTWRLIWWAKIVRYTIFGPYRWTGKGFGVNLAQVDGAPGLSREDTSLRSPHSAHMTILARMGVPGLALWIAINVMFAFRMFRAFRRASRARSQFWTGVNLWILCYWLAAVINMSFDVYLEGPDGGILFWTIIGFGIAALRIQSSEARQAVARARLEALHTDKLDFVATAV
jgi:hypothetical protein